MSSPHRRPKGPQNEAINAIEACRPGSQDLDSLPLPFLRSEIETDPQIANYYEQVQSLDAKIAEAFPKVPVADDLADRILASLNKTTPRPKLKRRRVAVLAGFSAIAACLALVLVVFSPNKRELTPQSEPFVLNEAFHHFEQVPNKSFHLLSDAPPPVNYPISRSIVAGHQARWSKVTNFLGCEGVVYDLSGTDEIHAMLYVIRGHVEHVGDIPATQPFSTEGYSASMWQENGLVYVLVVQGSPSTYRKCINLPGGPLAYWVAKQTHA